MGELFDGRGPRWARGTFQNERDGHSVTGNEMSISDGLRSWKIWRIVYLSLGLREV